MLNSILSELSQRNISEKECLIGSNISTSFFSDWKAGRLKSPSFDKIFRISLFLDVSIDSLVQNNPQKNISITSNSNSDLTLDEKMLINSYRDVSEEGKYLIQESVKEIWADHRIKKSSKKSDPKHKDVAI